MNHHEHQSILESKKKIFSKTNPDFFKSQNKISSVNLDLKDNLAITSSKKVNINSMNNDGRNRLIDHSSVQCIWNMAKVKRPKSQSFATINQNNFGSTTKSF